MKTVRSLNVNNGLPKSHKFINSIIENQTLPGIIWDDDDVVSDKEQLLLYKDWSTVHFASPWYEIEAEPEINEKATQRDIAILYKILGENFTPPATIIDIHCGSGRHAVDLAKKGFTVIGMEEVITPLELAKKAAKEHHVAVDFMLSNEENHKKNAGKADIVISMFNSLGYTFSQEDDQQQFNWIINLLKPGGYFVLDIRSHDYQKNEYAIAKTQQQKLSINNKEIATMYTTKLWENNVLGAFEKIVANGKTIQQTTYGWNTYSPESLKDMLRIAGSELTAIHEDYYENPSNFGGRIFVVAKKIQ